MDSVVHFEIPAEDMGRAEGFYRQVFGWGVIPMPATDVPYTMVTTTEIGDDMRPREAGAINGGIMARNPLVSSPVLVISVADIEGHLAKVREAGGTPAFEEPLRIGDMGLYALFQDTEGNVLGLWQNLQPCS